MLSKTFEPKTAEPVIYARWEASGAFSPEHALEKNPDAEPFCIVIPPPNVTGSLHMGHALNNTLQDVLARFHRMRGKSVLWLPGTDHAGIATQMVVERQLAAQGNVGRRELGREEFVKRIWQWKAESGGVITQQLRRLGASCDWGRERFTLDDGLSAAVRKVFVSLHKEGLLYRDKRLVNWDPQFQTAISDLEVETREEKGQMWSFAYPLEGEPIDGVSELVIATTRPETMLGDGAVAVHPDDERYKKFVGRMVRLPIADRLIPVIADEYPDPEKGSGAVKITGAHDFNDYQVARRHNLPLASILDDQGRIRGMGILGTEDRRRLERTAPVNGRRATPGRSAAELEVIDAIPENLRGQDRFVARKMIIEQMDALDLYRGAEDRMIARPYGDRSGVVIEPMLTEQWYVDAKTLAQDAIAAVEDGRTVFEPEFWSKTYFEWMRNIEPWCVSRQLWWGHRIPAWYGPEGSIFVEATEDEAKTAAREQFGREVELSQDEDVLDTWFSSALWPFSTLGWPNETEDLRRFYPTDTLVTGFDIIFFWVARMMMMGGHFMGQVPFRRVIINGLVRDEKGQKMSKSKGNVVDPLALIDEFGADALRFTMAILSGTRDIKLSKARVEGYRNFGTKLWNAARFCQMNECAVPAGFDPAAMKLPLNRWMRGEVVRASAAVTDAIEGGRFGEASEALYRFIWNSFCDWYLELAKPVLNGDDAAAKSETRAAAAWALDQAMRLLHPVSPFITEELWAQTAEFDAGRTGLLIEAAWPDLSADLVDPKADAEMGLVIATIAEGRSLRAELRAPPSAKPPLLVVDASPEAKRILQANAAVIGQMLRVSSVRDEPNPGPGALPFVAEGVTLALPLADVIDLAAEKVRLTKEIDALALDADRTRKKLDNADFVKRAPEAVVQQNRERLAEAEAALAKLQAALSRLQQADSPRA